MFMGQEGEITAIHTEAIWRPREGPYYRGSCKRGKTSLEQDICLFGSLNRHSTNTCGMNEDGIWCVWAQGVGQ